MSLAAVVRSEAKLLLPTHDRQRVLVGFERYESPPQAASLAQLGS